MIPRLDRVSRIPATLGLATICCEVITHQLTAALCPDCAHKKATTRKHPTIAASAIPFLIVFRHTTHQITPEKSPTSNPN
jgi:hypothetical protein